MPTNEQKQWITRNLRIQHPALSNGNSCAHGHRADTVPASQNGGARRGNGPARPHRHRDEAAAVRPSVTGMANMNLINQQKAQIKDCIRNYFDALKDGLFDFATRVLADTPEEAVP